jgi:hypothetical protein
MSFREGWMQRKLQFTNPKSEIRNPKSERSPKSEIRKADYAVKNKKRFW